MRKLLFSLALLVGFASQALAADNYAATAGSGLTFGAKDAAGVLYSRFIVCDNTTVSQCLAVDASGRLSIIPNTAINIAQINGVTVLMGNGATGTGSQRITIANDNTIPTGWPTAANQATANTALGAPGDSVCGSATGTCSMIALAKFLNVAAGLPLPVQTGIGNVNIGAVQSAGSAYETVAASATAQALGATGATGDYLSHCVVMPGTTSPGSFTILDNATTVFTFVGGASSVSNLVPFSIPVGALSVSGAWKITTTTNITAVCYGKFT